MCARLGGVGDSWLAVAEVVAAPATPRPRRRDSLRSAMAPRPAGLGQRMRWVRCGRESSWSRARVGDLHQRGACWVRVSSISGSGRRRDGGVSSRPPGALGPRWPARGFAASLLRRPGPRRARQDGLGTADLGLAGRSLGAIRSGGPMASAIDWVVFERGGEGARLRSCHLQVERAGGLGRTLDGVAASGFRRRLAPSRFDLGARRRSAASTSRRTCGSGRRSTAAMAAAPAGSGRVLAP